MATLQRPRMPGRQPSDFAENFDKARKQVDQELDDIPSPVDSSESQSLPGSLVASSVGSPATPATPLTGPVTPGIGHGNVADNFAFAFDIDGVLIRGGNPIPEAIEAMRVLNGENQYGIKVPYIFLTNGGGKTEQERCGDLSAQLEVDVSPGQFICGHTPMREMADRYKTVLVVGGEGEKCRLVAEGYGFKDVITPGDILKSNHTISPFRKLKPEEHANSRDLAAHGQLNDVVVDAVFVFADSREWASDLQIMLDIAMSKGGRLETRSETFDESPPFYFSHNDTLWAAQHEHPRLGMGALRSIVENTFSSVTGKKLKTHAFGKPQVSTFQFATRLLQKWRAIEHGLVTSSPPDTVYFVGDTPESDIRGTNAMDAEASNDWYSILVETGVYQEGTEPAYKPRVTVPNVLDAVNHGIEREMQAIKERMKSVGAGELGIVQKDIPLDTEHLVAIAS